MRSRYYGLPALAWAISATVATAGAAAPAPAAGAADNRAEPKADLFDQSGVPLEAKPTDPALAKIVVIAGKASKSGKLGDHEWFAGGVVLVKLLKQTPGVFPVLVRDGWPTDPDTLKGAKCVVFYMDGGGTQPFLAKEKMDVLEALAKAGCGIVHLHQVIDYPRVAGAQMLPLIGGAWDKEIGCRGHWVGECKDFPDHPSTRGVKPFTVDDGWIFNIRFLPEMRGVTPLIKLVPPAKLLTTADAKSHAGRAEVMAWAFDREGGGRSWTFVGGHLHSSWADENQRRFVVNGILWSAGQEIPAGAAPVAFDPAELNRHFDKKTPATPKAGTPKAKAAPKGDSPKADAKLTKSATPLETK